MDLKLDLEKACDFLEQSFIQDTLKFFQFLTSILNVIMNMVLTHQNLILCGMEVRFWKLFHLGAFVKVILYRPIFLFCVLNIFSLCMKSLSEIEKLFLSLFMDKLVFHTSLLRMTFFSSLELLLSVVDVLRISQLSLVVAWVKLLVITSPKCSFLQLFIVVIKNPYLLFLRFLPLLNQECIWELLSLLQKELLMLTNLLQLGFVTKLKDGNQNSFMWLDELL